MPKNFYNRWLSFGSQIVLSFVLLALVFAILPAVFPPTPKLSQAVDACQDKCGGTGGDAEISCYSNAGSGCRWRLPSNPNQPHWEGSYYCGKGEGDNNPPSDPPGPCKIIGSSNSGVNSIFKSGYRGWAGHCSPF